MLSILIPIYNINVVTLVHELYQQCKKNRIDFEIICIDDASTVYQKENCKLSNLEYVIYEELTQNIGRSRIRNLLASKSKYSKLLFLDGDSAVNDEFFVSRYLENINKAKVIYGGRNYQKTQPNDDTYFRWWYGSQRETILKLQREKYPYQSFMTNNFLIDKDVFLSIKLEEELIKGYGHEDTLFGIELKNRKISILHIENPLCHIGLEMFDEFLGKTEQALNNLNQLIKLGKVDNSIKIVKAYKKVNLPIVRPLIIAIYKSRKIKILTQLKNNKEPNLNLFDFYKLGYLLSSV